MRRLLLLPAILLILVGLVFTLQGVGILPGSAMSGQQQWAVIGIVMIVAGLVVGWLGMRRRRPGPAA
jgi:uncharacterized protein (TIGR03382 family)